jgi:hypothetical protein
VSFAGSRSIYGISVIALFAAIATTLQTPDRVGVALLFTAFVALVVVGSGVTNAAGPADSAARNGLAASVDGQAPSEAPFLAALAGGVAVLGLALGALAYAVAIVLAVLAAFAWLSSTHRTNPFHVSRVSDRISERGTLPFALPIIATLLIGVVAVSISRILLASTKNGAVAVAGVVAIVFLMGGIIAAIRPRSSRAQFWTVAVVGLLAVAGLGVAGIVRGETEIEHHEEKGHSTGTAEGKSGEGHSEGEGHSDGEAKPAAEGEAKPAAEG